MSCPSFQLLAETGLPQTIATPTIGLSRYGEGIGGRCSYRLEYSFAAILAYRRKYDWMREQFLLVNTVRRVLSCEVK